MSTKRRDPSFDARLAELDNLRKKEKKAFDDARKANKKLSKAIPKMSVGFTVLSPAEITNRLDKVLEESDRRQGERREMVNHPQYYGGDVPHETWKCLRAWGLDKDAYLWTAACYLSRCFKKGSLLEDLKKAQWYLAKKIELLESELNEKASD